MQYVGTVQMMRVRADGLIEVTILLFESVADARGQQKEVGKVECGMRALEASQFSVGAKVAIAIDRAPTKAT
jgi:hypothetical protein